MKKLRLSFSLRRFAALPFPRLLRAGGLGSRHDGPRRPAVGATAQGSPGELQIAFTQNIVVSFSGAELKTAEGAAIPIGKAIVDPASPNVLRAPIGQKLKPGTLYRDLACGFGRFPSQLRLVQIHGRAVNSRGAGPASQPVRPRLLAGKRSGAGSWMA